MHATVSDDRRRPRLLRQPDGRVLAGVCAGVADALGVDAIVVRVAIVLVTMIGGVGLLLYAMGWAFMPVAPQSAGRPASSRRERVFGQVVAAAALVLCAGLIARAAGVLHAGIVLWPLFLGTLGISMVFGQARSAGTRGDGGDDRTVRSRLRTLTGAAARLAAGLTGPLLIGIATVGVIERLGIQHEAGHAIASIAVVVFACALVLAPWAARMARTLADERSGRIREQERAEMAAHLHDSVLQTLALIQKRAGDAREVSALARRQERELRRWLFERSEPGAPLMLSSALGSAAAEIEEVHGVPIEVVTVGDAVLDRRLLAVVQAAREAMANAARFARCERIDLYAEAAVGRTEVFVRDRGTGFDLASIPADRQGVRQSIFERMRRHGGSAAIQTTPGEGTEVQLLLEGA